MRPCRTICHFLLLAALALPSTLQAVDYIVTRYDDPAPNGCAPTDCSLREAAIAASSGVDPDRIFLSAGRYEITRPEEASDPLGGDIDIQSEFELIGAGAAMTVIDGNSLDTVLDAGSVATSNECVIRDLAITGGLNNDISAGLMLSACTFTIDRIEIFGNEQIGLGTAGLALTISSFLTLRDSSIHDNIGTGFESSQSTAFLTNVTLSGNGDHEIDLANTSLLYCNQCTIRGDGVVDNDDLYGSTGTTLQLANSALLAADCASFTGGSLDSFGGNLESPGTTCQLDQASDQDAVASHGFGALLYNGGPTPTHLPSVTSPAVGGANDAFCTDTDQRGATRPDTNCDTGAVERVASTPPTAIFIDGFLQGDTEAWSDTVGD